MHLKLLLQSFNYITKRNVGHLNHILEQKIIENPIDDACTASYYN
jgi:hypothetical protein